MSNFSELASTLENVSFANLDSIASGEKSLYVGVLKNSNKVPKITLDGEIESEGFLVNEFDKVKNYSLPITLEESDELAALEKLSEHFSSMIPDSDDYTITTPARDEKIYLKFKLARDKKNFVARNNLKLNPNKIENTGIYRGQKVQVLGELGYYVNTKEKKAGLTFTLRKIFFEVDEEPVLKKQKK